MGSWLACWTILVWNLDYGVLIGDHPLFRDTDDDISLLSRLKFSVSNCQDRIMCIVRSHIVHK